MLHWKRGDFISTWMSCPRCRQQWLCDATEGFLLGFFFGGLQPVSIFYRHRAWYFCIKTTKTAEKGFSSPLSPTKSLVVSVANSLKWHTRVHPITFQVLPPHFFLFFLLFFFNSIDTSKNNLKHYLECGGYVSEIQITQSIPAAAEIQGVGGRQGEAKSEIWVNLEHRNSVCVCPCVRARVCRWSDSEQQGVGSRVFGTYRMSSSLANMMTALALEVSSRRLMILSNSPGLGSLGIFKDWAMHTPPGISNKQEKKRNGKLAFFIFFIFLLFFFLIIFQWLNLRLQ